MREKKKEKDMLREKSNNPNLKGGELHISTNQNGFNNLGLTLEFRFLVGLGSPGGW